MERELLVGTIFSPSGDAAEKDEGDNKEFLLVEYTGEGQVSPTDLIPEASSIGSKGFLVVRIVLDDEELASSLPLGAAGVAAIYTQSGKPFHIITKITMRIKGLMFFVPI